MIKNYIKHFLTGTVLLFTFTAEAQIATFDSLTLDSIGYWIPDAIGQTFTSGGATFVSSYDTNWGGYWTGGFGYSNHVDTTTSGYTNNYSTYAGAAYSGDQFAIVDGGANANAKIKFDSPQKIQGFYVSNSTYAALSMRDGDSFGKIFGADTLANGSDTLFDGSPVTNADWFKVTVTPYHGDSLYASEAIEHYLADYRFSDNSLDYILKGWQWVDLTFLSESDSLLFILSSSDVSAYGINTPTYFCIDDVTFGEFDGKEELMASLISVYPNPSSNFINLKIPSTQFEVSVLDNLGRVVKTSSENRIDVSDLNSGVYFVSILVDNVVINKRFIKQ